MFNGVQVLKKYPVYILLVLVLLTASCSSERNTWTSKTYHNLTAHYNGYYYAREEIKQIEEIIHKSQVDDYNHILRLFPTFDSTLAKTYEKSVQEAIKMASIAIQRHPNSKWVDDAYILVGKARLYSLDWGNAIRTFKYANKIGKDKNTSHNAVLNLIRTYVEHEEFNNAQAAIDYLEKANLNKVNKKKFYLEKAYYYQVRNDYDNMVRNLTAADELLRKSDRRGRIYFIIGQVYQKIGFEAEAYNYYKKCLATNPEYEVDFYARLYMAQVTEISRNRDVNAARKSFRRLLKDSKNREFRDKIYYEMGLFELKQNNLDGAIENFNLSIRTGSNKRIDGEAYLRLGEIYYDTLKDYELSQAYYDSAINVLPTDYQGYAAIKARQEILNEFVKHLKTISWQDSLLSLATLDSVTLRSKIDSALTARKALAEGPAGKKKKRIERIGIVSTTTNNFFSPGTSTSSGTSDWYFGNPSAMALGQAEFIRVWGNIKLQDYWRISQRNTLPNSFASSTTPSQSTTGQANHSTDEPKTVDPVDAEFARINGEIPRTEEARKNALKKIEEATFSLGGIYYFKLNENQNAANTYKTFLKRFPDSEHEPEVLYTLYLIQKETDSLAAAGYAAQLKSKHPGSTFAKILINPNYLKESSQAMEKQQQLYKTAYKNFRNENLAAADSIVKVALALGETAFTPSLELLRILITGKTDDITRFQYELSQFIAAYPQHELNAYAQKLLDTSREFQANQEKRRGIRYIHSFEEPHYFVIVYRQQENLSGKAARTLESFNASHFSELNLKTGNLILNDEYALTFVSDLPRIGIALEYYKLFNEKLTSLTELKNHKFSNFVITKDNFDIFYRTKGLDEYIQFFARNYPAENP